MKFRCERDVLVEALGSAGRAVASRGGALPVLSGVRLETAGDDLAPLGPDRAVQAASSASACLSTSRRPFGRSSNFAS